MALDRQVKILNVDTSNFYSGRERRLHELNHRLRAERNRLVNGGFIVNSHGVKRTVRGTRQLEADLAEFGVSPSDVKAMMSGEYDFSVHGDDADTVCDMAVDYACAKSIADMKTRKANEVKGELLSLLSNKVEANERSGQRHHVRVLDESTVSEDDVIAVFDSYFTRTIGARVGEFTDDFMIVRVFYFDVLKDLIFNGFTYKGERYVYFTSSAGQIRTKKCVFVKESVWRGCERSIMCGLTLDDINAKGGINPNKYLAYNALSNSATDVWEEFDIDRCIVIDDFATEVYGTYDFVSDADYGITRERGHREIEHTDGAGMMLPNAFGVLQNNKMVRIPWIKGLLCAFPFDEFIRENGCSPVIRDIYGEEHDVLEEDIQVIFTKSQFKLHGFYDSWEDYRDKYHANGCTAGFTNEEEERIRDATINYQMLQSLTDITEDEMASIASRSVGRLEGMCSSVADLEAMFGVTPYNTSKTAFQKCIELYPELMNDEYAKSRVRRIKDSVVKRCKAGKLDVHGKYTFVVPDFYAACEHWFMGIDEPDGLLGDGEVFCWLFRKDRELDCLRSPHLFLEHAIRTNVAARGVDDERVDRLRDWYCTDAVYTSCKDLISRILQFDCDGDKLLMVADETIIDVAKRNIEKFDIVPLYYDMKKASPVHLDNKAIYDGLNAAFVGGNIGVYSNNISKIWNSDVFVDGTIEEQKEAVELIKILCMENNYVIDYAKTLYKPERPGDMNERLTAFTGQPLPHFFKYAKDKSDSQVVGPNGSFVNRLETIIPNPRINMRRLGLGEIDHELLMSDPGIEFDVAFTSNGRVSEEGTDPLIVEYCKFDKRYYMNIDAAMSSCSSDKGERYMRSRMRNGRIADEIRVALSKFGYGEREVVDILVKFLYGIRKSSNKTALWLCYGDVIYENLSAKLKPRTKSVRCVDCGEWFDVSVYDSATERCDECQREHRKMLRREQNRRAYLRKKAEKENSVSTL